MDERIAQMESMRAFWKIYKDECIRIRSIDDVFSKYVIYVNEIKVSQNFKYSPINKYIFRTFIRKNGYNNSAQDIEEFIKQKENKRIRKKIKKVMLKKKKTQEDAEYEVYREIDKEKLKKKEKLEKNNLSLLEKRNIERNQPMAGIL